MILLLVFSVLATAYVHASSDATDLVSNKPYITKATPELQRMFDRLKAQAGPAAKNAKIYINHTSNAIQAITWSDDSIVIHKGELIFNKDYPDQLAFVIGHELGHVVLKHLGWRYPFCRATEKAHRMCEKDADLYGKMLMAKAGYDKCEAAKIWKRMADLFGNLDGVSHPTYLQRYEYLRCK